MAKNSDKEKVVQALKFVPRNIEIQVQGPGGEMVVGSITKEQYDFWSDDENNENLESHLFDYGDDLDIPEAMKMAEDGNWYENDDLYHRCLPWIGATCTLTDIKTGEEIDEFEISQETHNDLVQNKERELFIDNYDEKYEDDPEMQDYDAGYDPKSDHHAYVCAISAERGSYHEGTITLTKPYERGDIQFHTREINERDTHINSTIWYDGKPIDCDLTGDSTGKGYYCYVDKNHEHPDNKE